MTNIAQIKQDAEQVDYTIYEQVDGNVLFPNLYNKGDIKLTRRKRPPFT